MLFLKLPILNKHRNVTGYLNRLSAFFAPILVNFIFFAIKKINTGKCKYKIKQTWQKISP